MKTSFSTKQWTAIRWFFETNKLLPLLSTYPYVRFESRETRERDQKHIDYITQLYKTQQIESN